MSYNKVEKYLPQNTVLKTLQKMNISHLSSMRQKLDNSLQKKYFQDTHLILLVEYNVFLSITFPVFPSFQFSKLTFFRDSPISFQFNKTMSNKNQYILSQYRNIHIIGNYSVAESVTVFQLLLFIHMETYFNHDFTEIVFNIHFLKS